MGGKKPKGKRGVKRSEQQQKFFDQVISALLSGEDKESSVNLQTAWFRGDLANTVLQDSVKFGAAAIDDIAIAIHRSRSTVNRCLAFRRYVSKAQLTELCTLDGKPQGYRVPPWRLMMMWVGIKDDTQRDNVMRDILAGRLTDSMQFETAMRSALGSGPAQSRRARSPQATFSKIASKAITLTGDLERFVDDAVTRVASISDAVVRRDAKQLVAESVKNMRALQMQLAAAIARCQGLIT